MNDVLRIIHLETEREQLRAENDRLFPIVQQWHDKFEECERLTQELAAARARLAEAETRANELAARTRWYFGLEARLAEAELALRRVSATIWGGSGQTIISEYFDKRATDSASGREGVSNE